MENKNPNYTSTSDMFQLYQLQAVTLKELREFFGFGDMPEVEGVNVIKVGSDDAPAGAPDIEDIRKQINEIHDSAKKGVNKTLVTHHNVNFENWKM